MEVLMIASWPRSGNTLVRAILWHCFGVKTSSCYDETDSLLSNSERADIVGAFSSSGNVELMRHVAEQQGLIAMKTHFSPQRMDKLADYPAIYVVRDGREACVSAFHFANGMLLGSVDSMEQTIRGHKEYGSWSGHLRAWSPKTRPDTLLLRYEDVAVDVVTAVDQIAAFIGRGPISYRMPSFEKFKSTFPMFYRSGTNTTWETEMTVDQLDLFWELHGDAMEEYGYCQEAVPCLT